VNGSCAGVVFGFTGVDEFEESFGGDVTVADEHTVNVERSVQEILVVACKDVLPWESLPDHGDLGVPSPHIAHTVLHRKYTFLTENVELSLEVVCGFGIIGVLKEDEGKTGSFVDFLVSSLGSTLLVAESQPSVRRVEETGLSTSFLGSFRLETCDVVAFTGDTGNDGDFIVDRFDESLDDLALLLRRQEGTLAGVTKDNETFDTVDRAEPRAESLNRFVVDRAVFVEGRDRGWGETGHVKADAVVRRAVGTVDRRHDGVLLWVCSCRVD